MEEMILFDVKLYYNTLEWAWLLNVSITNTSFFAQEEISNTLAAEYIARVMKLYGVNGQLITFKNTTPLFECTLASRKSASDAVSLDTAIHHSIRELCKKVVNDMKCQLNGILNELENPDGQGDNAVAGIINIKDRR